MSICTACRNGKHHHDRHTGVQGRAGDDAGCPNAVDSGQQCGCSFVLPPIGGRRHRCPTCACKEPTW